MSACEHPIPRGREGGRREGDVFWLCLLLSLGLHLPLLLGGGWRLSPPRPGAPAGAEAVQVDIVPTPPPPERAFVDTDGLDDTRQPVRPSDLISTRNTPASDPAGIAGGTGLPLLEGETEALTLGMAGPETGVPDEPGSTDPGTPPALPVLPPVVEEPSPPAPRAQPAAKPVEAQAPPAPAAQSPRPVIAAPSDPAPQDFRDASTPASTGPKARKGPADARQTEAEVPVPAPGLEKASVQEPAPARPAEAVAASAAGAQSAAAPAAKPSTAGEEGERRPAVLSSGIGRDLSRMRRTDRSDAAPGSRLSVATSEHDYAAYLKEVRSRVQLSWVLGYAMDPRLVYETVDGHPIIIDFRILPDGRLDKVEIEDNAGNAFLAGALKKSIMEAVPFPEFAKFKVHEPDVQIRFFFYAR